MRDFYSILGNIYDSEDFNCKGISTQGTEGFFFQKSGELYLAMIMERMPLGGEEISYEYALYSLTNDKYIEKNTEQYDEVTDGFPSLAGADDSDAKVDFFEDMRLKDLFVELVNEAMRKGTLTEQTFAQYQMYLADMRKMKSTFFQPVYAYFEAIIVK